MARPPTSCQSKRVLTLDFSKLVIKFLLIVTLLYKESLPNFCLFDSEDDKLLSSSMAVGSGKRYIPIHR